MEIRELTPNEIDYVSGGFICGGLCVLGGIAAGIGFFTGGYQVGSILREAFD